jgi:hypothetical protein
MNGVVDIQLFTHMSYLVGVAAIPTAAVRSISAIPNTVSDLGDGDNRRIIYAYT